jgi:hypothetical protein
MKDEFREQADPSSVQSNDGGRRPRTSATGSQEPRNGDAPKKEPTSFEPTLHAVAPPADMAARREEARAILVRLLATSVQGVQVKRAAA